MVGKRHVARLITRGLTPFSRMGCGPDAATAFSFHAVLALAYSYAKAGAVATLVNARKSAFASR